MSNFYGYKQAHRNYSSKNNLNNLAKKTFNYFNNLK